MGNSKKRSARDVLSDIREQEIRFLDLKFVDLFGGLQHVTIPSEVVDERSLVVVVADVMGKGIPASLLMATLHAAVNSNEDVRKKPANHSPCVHESALFPGSPLRWRQRTQSGHDP